MANPKLYLTYLYELLITVFCI